MEWVKIGEIQKSAKMFQFGLYAQYAVMEKIKPNGMRQYKSVLMCVYTNIIEPIKARQVTDL